MSAGRMLLLLWAAPLAVGAAGCLDFSILATPPDGGGANDLSSSMDLDPCFNPTGSPSECSANNECVSGLCLAETGPGQCVIGCATDGECSCPGSLCVAPTMGENFCSRLCDLVAQTGCPKGMACDISRDGLRAFTYCRDDGTVATGDSCIAPLECLAGNLCLATETCARWCHVGVATDCTGMLKCKSLSNPVKVNGVTYGVCSL